jgi:hypothetical protein
MVKCSKYQNKNKEGRCSVGNYSIRLCHLCCVECSVKNECETIGRCTTPDGKEAQNG